MQHYARGVYFTIAVKVQRTVKNVDNDPVCPQSSRCAIQVLLQKGTAIYCHTRRCPWQSQHRSLGGLTAKVLMTRSDCAMLLRHVKY